MTWVALGAAGIAAAGSVAGGEISSNAAGQAAGQAAAGQNAALQGNIGSTQAATNAMSPYYQGGLVNYDLLNYLMSGTMPSAATGAGGQTWQQITQNVPGVDNATDIPSAIANLQNYINRYPTTRGGQSGKYGAQLADAESALTQLQQLQSQNAVETQATQAIGNLGLPGGYFTQAAQTPFSYNPMTDTNLQGAANIANQELTAGASVYGGVGSGNTANALYQDVASTLEPEYYNMALQQYQQNYQTNPMNLYNMLTGNMAGAGGTAAQNMANLYTGQAANAGQYLSGAGNAQATGTTGAANASTNALTGIGNIAQSAAGTYLKNQSQQQLYNLIAQQNGVGGGYSSVSYDPTAGVDMSDPYAALYQY